VRWNVAGRMALAWLFTLPAAAVVGGVAAAVAKQGTAGVVVICVAAVAVAAGIYVISRRNPVHHDNVNDQPTAPVAAATAATAA
jgi:PiT family inorganic phosphate transporter